ncbi:SNF2 family N-terminal domain-containing protein [Podospora aff. communis PSN243]|uniref:SNF2 family N-terminal domain-containing protein n=1 Tax=Podospora aff. communis PSN243 TaxID=3040156 RepID=A0AAV9FZS0_9PEZI|nr:SNF2 family N-terminal domain-containing protein [Podospora aff. communis PSN243]
MDYPADKRLRIHHAFTANGVWVGAAVEAAPVFPAECQWFGQNSINLVCYGMIQDLDGTCVAPFNVDGGSGASFPVVARSAYEFAACNDHNVTGKFAPGIVDMLEQLINDGDMILQFTCTPESGHQSTNRSRFAAMTVACTLSLILYGPPERCEEVGQFFQDSELYLQDPKGCDLNTRYCNPHRLSSLKLEECPMTFSLELPTIHVDQAIFRQLSSDADILDIFNAQENLPETQQPDVIYSQLKRHQKQALTFLLKREAGWDFDPASADFWDQGQTSSNQIFFINKVSQFHQLEEPPEFCGGIVADPMGLGKTLTMIALAATDANDTDLTPSLIIVPPPLLDTWEEQLSWHVKPGEMRVRRHYQKERILNQQDVCGYDIVLTTYHTIMADWAGGKEFEDKLIFATTWRRIILDEAHVIRNIHSQISKSVCALSATARWAVTGTPIQNRVGDLAALLKFIRAYPYDDIRQFDAEIGKVWKTGEVEEAAKKLKKLSASLILRRPKTVIELPPRVDLKCSVDFTAQERKVYEHLKNNTIAQIEEACGDGEKKGAASSYINVIQRINAMRMMCNVGLHYDTRRELSSSNMNGPANWAEQAQAVFDSEREMDRVDCANCHAKCDLAAAIATPEARVKPLFTQCLRFFCSDCVQEYNRRQKTVTCGHSPPDPVAPVLLDLSELGGDARFRLPGNALRSIQLSSKVAALVSQLVSLPVDTKSVVFSSWRMSLDLVEAGLQQAGISYLRFDGTLPQKQRQPVIESFRRDPRIRVFLLTLSCGAVGLTLTEASRAYLLEPHWNPTIEEQALARVYRLGQLKEVTTVRFYVRDTFEERVLDLQESKKKLESVLLAGHSEQSSDDNVNHLEDLRRLV